MNRFAMLPLTWPFVLSDVFRLGIAYLLALPIGWNREREHRSAGLRTFPIVAVAACAFTLLGTSIPGATNDSYSRILQGLITGIGFIGGGAILHDKGMATGTETAAGIWSIGIVGAAVAFGRYDIALLLTLITLLTFKVLTPLKRRLDEPPLNGPATSVAKPDSADSDASARPQ
jgi:putative Mg2+ transporter-C (MgtC) family protein